jgi:hypothetical protein
LQCIALLAEVEALLDAISSAAAGLFAEYEDQVRLLGVWGLGSGFRVQAAAVFCRGQRPGAPPPLAGPVRAGWACCRTLLGLLQDPAGPAAGLCWACALSRTGLVDDQNPAAGCCGCRSTGT